MAELMFISDTHFSHANILTFRGLDDELIRPEFDSVEEMDQTMVDNWNAVVSTNTHIYHLGDVAMGRETIGRILPRLNGKKRLILGNHDDYKYLPELMKHFEKIMESRTIDSLLFTHRPIRLVEFEFRTKANVHGHIHEKDISDQDPRYLNVSVERINYTPVHYEWIVDTLRARGVDV